MKEQIKALFGTLPAQSRAKYHALYCSVIRAIEDEDSDLIPFLLESVPPTNDQQSQSEFLGKVRAILQQ